MPRLFVAIDLPGKLQTQLSTFSHTVGCGRPVPAEQLHLTLRFIGEVDEPTALCIRQCLASISCPPFSITLADVGFFPPRGAPRLLFLGITANRHLHELQSLVEQGVVSCGLPAEKRPFSPHITLTRFRQPPRAAELHRFTEEFSRFSSLPMTISYFSLYQSILNPSGAEHRLQATFPLS
jgi:2'-5' RNA ligase